MDLDQLFSKFPSLETSRLYLREILDSDLDAIFSIFSNIKVTEFYGIDPLKSRADGEKTLRSCIDRFPNRKGIRWGLALKQSGQLIGTIGLQKFNEQSCRAEIGFDLIPEFWRKGFMSEALQTVVDFGLSEIRIHRIEAFCEPKNVASMEMLKRAGFQQEGLLKGYFRWSDGFHDATILARLNGTPR